MCAHIMCVPARLYCVVCGFLFANLRFDNIECMFKKHFWPPSPPPSPPPHVSLLWICYNSVAHTWSNIHASGLFHATLPFRPRAVFQLFTSCNIHIFCWLLLPIHCVVIVEFGLRFFFVARFPHPLSGSLTVSHSGEFLVFLQSLAFAPVHCTNSEKQSFLLEI